MRLVASSHYINSLLPQIIKINKNKMGCYESRMIKAKQEMDGFDKLNNEPD
jgi:hypothetical protein